MKTRIRLGIILAIVCGLVVSVIPLGDSASAQQPRLDQAYPGGHFFTQANGQPLGTSFLGYAVTNESNIPFLDAFRFVGGVEAVGFPASRRFVYNGFTTQIFQKAVFQFRPDQGNTVVFANIIDAIGDAGKDDWLFVVRSTPNRLPTSFDEGAADFRAIVARRQAILDQVPPIKQRYFAAPDPISLYGLPTSQPRTFGAMQVVRFQRAIMQYYTEDTPWARRGQVLIANGGDVAKEADVFDKTALTPESPPAAAIAAGMPGQPAAPAAPAPAAPAPAPGGGATTTGSYPGVGYGMQVDQQGLAYGAEMTRQAGFSWVKMQLRWENLEGSKGAINWGDIDRFVNGAAGLKIMFSVVTAPAWSRPRDTDMGVPGPPSDPNEFARFLGAIAARHKGKIAAIEVWNEANLWYEWGGRGRKLSAKGYVDMLRPAYQAIKAADPAVVVVLGAPTPTGVNDGDIAIDDAVWIQQLYEAGAKEFCDAIGLHPSGFNNPPDDWLDKKTTPTTTFKGHGSVYFRRFEQIRDIQVNFGDGAKQQWFTEFGWASSPNPYPEYAYARDNSEQNQADYLVRAFAIAKEKGYIGPMFVWNLNFAAGAEPDDRYAKKAFAILHPDGRPRPAYDALKAMRK